jgi:catechol 2,3-dioxygenase-like lactoylglutathione lyase family enzyme
MPNKPSRIILVARAVVGLGLAFAAPLRAVSAQGVSTAQAPTTLRTTLVVGDMDKSIDFYQRLGLLKISDIAGANTDQGGVFGAVDLPLTADSKSSRHVYMRSGDGLLALVTYDRPQLPSARGNLVGVGVGDIIVSIEIRDIEGAYERLNQVGTRFQRTPIRFTQPGIDGAPQSGQHLLAYDPDGHMVEVTQMDRR